MNTIDILCVVDANTLITYWTSTPALQQQLAASTAAAPISLGAWSTSDQYIFMIADGSYATNGQGKSELTVTANVNDQIRWTIANPSEGVTYNCVLCGFSSNSGSFGTLPNAYLTVPTPSATAATSYFTYPDNPTTPVITGVVVSPWLSTLLQPTPAAGAQYNATFMVIDSGTTTILGYFNWDPFIIIN